MVHSKNFVAVVKCNGNILRDNNGVVRLPFGSEYSILLKNLNSRKAVVEITIDGNDVCDNHWLIVNPNVTTELKGVIKNSKVKNKFKFIQKTDEIAEYLGDKIDDGVIRIEVKYEAVREELPITTVNWWQDAMIGVSRQPDIGWHSAYYTSAGDGNVQSSFTTSCSVPLSCDNGQNVCMDSCGDSLGVKRDEGITVKGSKTNQVLTEGYTDTLESQSTVITIILKGTSKKLKVQKPIFVKSKVQCETCGRKCKSNVNFCPNCGTKL